MISYIFIQVHTGTYSSTLLCCTIPGTYIFELKCYTAGRLINCRALRPCKKTLNLQIGIYPEALWSYGDLFIQNTPHTPPSTNLHT